MAFIVMLLFLKNSIKSRFVRKRNYKSTKILHTNIMKILLTKVMYEKNVSVRQLSNMTGIPKSTINNIMIEKYSPTLDNLERIAKALKVGMVDLFDSPYK